LSQLEAEIAKPIRSPTLDEVAELAINLQARLSENVEVGRTVLSRWLHAARGQDPGGRQPGGAGGHHGAAAADGLDRQLRARSARPKTKNH
jgi:hypothetical protein